MMVVMLISVLPMGATHAQPDEATPAERGAHQQVARGQDVSYEIVQLAPAYRNGQILHQSTIGSGITEYSRLLVGIIEKKEDAEFPEYDKSAINLIDQGSGAVAFPWISEDCYPYFWATRWRPISAGRDGSVLGVVNCIHKTDSSKNKNMVVHWESEKVLPRTILSASPQEVQYSLFHGTEDGHLLHVDLDTKKHVYSTYVTSLDGASRRISPSDPSSEVYGTDLAEQGTVAGVILPHADAGQLATTDILQKPFVASGGSSLPEMLPLPAGVTAPSARKTPATIKVSPDGRRIIGAIGTHTIAWDAQRRPTILSSTSAITPVKLLNGNKALVNSIWGPGILRGGEIRPLVVADMPPGAKLQTVAGINTSQEIAATLLLPSGLTQAVLLSPSS
ncbi:hypothetical protein [Austwickia sp. TVS 96-490-7B]|uniref:hypothetical protein n=1 Tax=Austwickia sp. TVS 96-490-7B TaxID=2830843 RepID=UPI001C59E3C3|nr:hypothetical protein [Austwickia sp. TVS 96-490-7B]